MAYNKAKEEYKWKVWKEQEEKKLRELGVSEEVMQNFVIMTGIVLNKNVTTKIIKCLIQIL